MADTNGPAGGVREIMIDNRARLTVSELQQIEALFGKHRTLEDVLRWGLAQRPVRIFTDVTVQDELSYDIVLGHDAGRYLVFGTTCLGAITSLAVWDHRPTAQELLEARLAHGWRPTSTATQTGPRILGFAAQCAGQRAPAHSSWTVRRAG